MTDELIPPKAGCIINSTSDLNETDSHKTLNAERYINTYAENLLKKFRIYNDDKFSFVIYNLKCFLDEDETILQSLLQQLQKYNFFIELKGTETSVSTIKVYCNNETKNEDYCYDYQIQDITSIIELSSKTDIPIAGIIIMRVVAQTIIKLKILYKAIVFDLDDTLWPGTLAEIGKDAIKKNLKSDSGKPFVMFMNFIKVLADELGVFIAICSRNNIDAVKSVLNDLDECIFPLKNQIDCIVANYNDKSENIKEIAKQLNILPESIVFIDDNQIIRDEVRRNVHNIFVPEWQTLSELETQLITGCIFERNELSINTQERRKQYKVLQIERKKSDLPNLLVMAYKDVQHKEAKRLYAKTNQFKFSQETNNFGEGYESIYFEMYRETGDSLGICSAVTYIKSPQQLIISNWAISCRYFEIGLEEFILSYLFELSQAEQIHINYSPSEFNNKVGELLNKYPQIFSFKTGDQMVEIQIDNSIRNNTNLKLK